MSKATKDKTQTKSDTEFSKVIRQGPSANILGFGGGRWEVGGLPRELTCEEVPPKECQEPKKEVPKK